LDVEVRVAHLNPPEGKGPLPTSPVRGSHLSTEASLNKSMMLNNEVLCVGKSSLMGRI
jgi:hypothetical protein